MNKQNHKKSIKTFLSIVGVAGASILMSFPAFAQTPTTPSNRDSSTRNQQMNDNQSPINTGSMQGQTSGSQQMNNESNGSAPSDGNRLPTDNRYTGSQQTPGSQPMTNGTSGTQQTDGQRLPTDDRSMQGQNTGSQQINTGSTTTETQIRRTTSQEVSPGSTTTTPSATPTTTPAATPTTNQSQPDSGVRALW